MQREAAEYLFSFFPGLEDKISVDQYLEERVEMQDAEFRRVPYMRGALELVQGLHAQGIPIALATGSTSRNFEVKTVSYCCLLLTTGPPRRSLQPLPS